MNSTLLDTSASKRLQNAIPTQAQELLAVEKRERERVMKEKETLQERALALEQTLASELPHEERSLAEAGMKILQEFHQKDLTSLVAQENAKTEEEAVKIKNAGLARVNGAAKKLVQDVTSGDFSSRL